MLTLNRISPLLLLAASVTSLSAQDPAAVYKTNCAPCHGVNGDANTPAGKVFKVPSFNADSVLKESDEHLLTIAKNGKGAMPPWNDKISEEDLKGVIAFIHTLQKK